ncbi:MAG: DUF2029 domain-containing protein [bacterium]|nr:MAG: DUF2029 domain-containing protein [bacterium]
MCRKRYGHRLDPGERWRRSLLVTNAGTRWECKATLVAVSLALALVAVYYRVEWKSVSGFVSAIDHCDTLFCDFVRHFHTMGRIVLSSARPVGGYLYSAFFSLLLVPFGSAPLPAATWFWGALQIVLGVLLCIVPLKDLLRLSWRGTTLYVFLFVTSLPLLHNFKWGQVSVLVTLCIIASFHAYRRDRRVLAGFLLALGTSIKYYPGIFILYYVFRRDLRVLSSFLVALLILFFVSPALVMGPYQWLTFHRESFAAIPDSSLIAQNPNSQYFAHVALRFMSSGATGTAAVVLKLLGYAVACANLALLWLIQKSSVRDKEALSAVTLFLALPFILQTSWPHYFVFLPFCQAVLLKQLHSFRHSHGFQSILLSAATVVSCALSSVFVFNRFDHWITYSRYGMLLCASLLLQITLYRLVASVQRLDMSKSLPIGNAA